MAKFKVGQKVVYNGKYMGVNAKVSYPKIDEIVTIERYCRVFSNHVDISEYLTAKDGKSQSFDEREFEPLIEDETTDHIVTFISSPDSRKLAKKARDYNPMEVPEHLTQEV